MDYTFGGDYRQQSVFFSKGTKAEGAAEAAEAGLDRLKYALLVSYVFLLVVLPIISYILARQALKPLEKSFEEQQRFVDDASHELRTPLSILQGELELALKKQRKPVEYKAAIATSLDEVIQMNSLVHNLLLMARGSRAQLYKSAETVKLEQLVANAVAINRREHAVKKLHYKVNIEAVSIVGIVTLLEQSIANLLDNAAKFSDQSGSITVSLETDETYAVITIADAGIGMSAEQLSHAFDKFWRADEARTVKGFGLGLSIVQQIAQLHGGDISLAPNEYGGVTARLSIPRQLSRSSHT